MNRPHRKPQRNSESSHKMGIFIRSLHLSDICSYVAMLVMPRVVNWKQLLEVFVTHIKVTHTCCFCGVVLYKLYFFIKFVYL